MQALNREMVAAERERSAEKEKALRQLLVMEQKLSDGERAEGPGGGVGGQVPGAGAGAPAGDARAPRRRGAGGRAAAVEDEETSQKLKAEAKDLREHNKLLKEHLDVTKDLLDQEQPRRRGGVPVGVSRAAAGRSSTARSSGGRGVLEDW